MRRRLSAGSRPRERDPLDEEGGEHQPQNRAILPTTITVQIRVDVSLSGSPPRGESTLKSIAPPPAIPPICRNLERLITGHGT